MTNLNERKGTTLCIIIIFISIIITISLLLLKTNRLAPVKAQYIMHKASRDGHHRLCIR